MTTSTLRTAASFRQRHPLASAALAGALVLGTLGSLQGCVLLLGAGVVGSGLVISDRRTSGTQLEDQSIEFKSGPRIRDAIGNEGHINVTSYSRIVLVTGEVPSQADKDAVGKAVGGIENVNTLVNELLVGDNSSVGSRSSDTVITGKVKSALVDAKDLQSNAFKIVTERGTVYLMGRVTEREATRASDIARNVGGVMRVVRVFDILTEEQLANLNKG